MTNEDAIFKEYCESVGFCAKIQERCREDIEKTIGFAVYRFNHAVRLFSIAITDAFLTLSKTEKSIGPVDDEYEQALVANNEILYLGRAETGEVLYEPSHWYRWVRYCSRPESEQRTWGCFLRGL